MSGIDRYGDKNGKKRHNERELGFMSGQRGIICRGKHRREAVSELWGGSGLVSGRMEGETARSAGKAGNEEPGSGGSGSVGGKSGPEASVGEEYEGLGRINKP